MPLALVRQALSQRAKSHDDIMRGVEARLPWVWDQLCFGAVMRETGADAFLDVVNGVRGVGNAAGIGSGWKTDNHGNPSFLMSTVHYVEYPDHPVHDRPDTALTAMVRYRIFGTTANTGVFTLPHTIGASPWMTWGIISPATSIRAVRGHLTVDGTPVTMAVSGTVIAIRLDVTVFLRWRSGEAPQVDVYDERGNLLSQVVHGSSLTGSLTYDASKGIRLNATDDVSPCGNNIYSQALLWSRRLTDTETVALTMDPYGWYSPRRMTVGLSGVYLVPFGGGDMQSGITSRGPGMVGGRRH
jgi:hypothetical protein